MSRSEDPGSPTLRLYTGDNAQGPQSNRTELDEEASDVTDLPQPIFPVLASGVIDKRPKSVKEIQNLQFSRRGSARDIHNLRAPPEEPTEEEEHEKAKSTKQNKQHAVKSAAQGVMKPWMLKNEGSVARDHMANERTFLAWIRSGLTILTLGVAFVQMYSISSRATFALMDGATEENRKLLQSEYAGLEVLAKPLSILCAIFAAFMICAGYWRYLRVQAALTNNQFPASRAMALIVVMLALVVWGLLLGLAIRTRTT